MALHDQHFSGVLYRALNPIYSAAPLSGDGARRYGGRFNPQGIPALYASLSPLTALREANQAGSLQPTMVVSYLAEIGPILDSQQADLCLDYGLQPNDLSDHAWRAKMIARQPVPTQEFAERLRTAGFAGLLVRSFANGATDKDLNMVLWKWNAGGNSLVLIDDENRI